MATARTSLRRELTERLLPELQKRGFAGPRAIAGNALLHDFKRPSGQRTHVLTVQLEKHGLPRFVINLTIEPPEGFNVLIERGGTVIHGRAQPRPGATTRSWFRADLPIWKKLLGLKTDDAAGAVSACLSLLPEIETWWETQACSKHIVALPVHFPGSVKVQRA